MEEGNEGVSKIVAEFLRTDYSSEGLHRQAMDSEVIQEVRRELLTRPIYKEAPSYRFNVFMKPTQHQMLQMMSHRQDRPMRAIVGQLIEQSFRLSFR